MDRRDADGRLSAADRPWAPGCVRAPLVLRPDLVPLVTDAEVASEAPELAVLSAMAHGGHPDVNKVLDVLHGVLVAVDPKHFALYSDLDV